MHAIMPCTAFPAYPSSSSSPDAGRLPIAAPIPTRPLYNAIKIWEAALDAEDTQTATPIPTHPRHMVANNIQDFKPARTTPVAVLPVPLRSIPDDFVLVDKMALIKYIRTFDKPETQEKLYSGRLSCSVHKYRIDSRATLGPTTVNKINKRAGPGIFKRYGIKMARLFGGPILQAHLRP